MPVKRATLRIRLTIDDALASYLRALVASPVGIYGDERETIIFALRSFMIDHMKAGSGFREQIMRELPDDIRSAWENSRIA
jgi:hypothetical protein